MLQTEGNVYGIPKKWENSQYRKGSAINFCTLTDEWLLEKKMFFKESTVVKYQNLLKLHLIPEFGDCFLEEITYEKIRIFIGRLLLHGGAKEKGLSPKMVSDIMSLFCSIVRYANSRGFSTPLVYAHEFVRQQKKPVRVFSVEEQKKLYKYLKEEKTHTSTAILLCMFTGLRIGEVCALKWEDIFMEDRTVFVHQTMQRLQADCGNARKTKILISEPKSLCSIRRIPIPEEVFHMLAEEKALPEAFLLTGLSSKYIEPRTLQYRFQKVLQNCKIENANFHTLRHTFATRCIEVGFDLKSLSEILGHANVNITLNRYVHPSMDLKRNNMEKLSGLFTV